MRTAKGDADGFPMSLSMILDFSLCFSFVLFYQINCEQVTTHTQSWCSVNCSSVAKKSKATVNDLVRLNDDRYRCARSQPNVMPKVKCSLSSVAHICSWNPDLPTKLDINFSFFWKREIRRRNAPRSSATFTYRGM